ncbi:MAG: sulfite exporter TauE/SafE family protein [Thermodesulfobacteriota bacterium]|nr:sulfite exporter TauE/SafE family protein [Thermodesulfobacteriota bacterium]
MNLLILLPVIFGSSLILTMIGLGGGLVFSPFFVLIGFPISTAVAASLFLNGIAALSALIVYMQKKMVDYSVAIPLVVTSLLGAPIGALMTHRINTKIFFVILAMVLFLAAMRMLFSKKVESQGEKVSWQVRILGGGVIGLLIGFMGGLLGIGGGVFIVPLLIYLIKVPTKVAAASSIFIVCFSSFSGFAVHAATSSLDWRFIILASICSFAGGQIGSRIMAEKLKGKTIRVLFGIILLLMCTKLLYKAFI